MAVNDPAGRPDKMAPAEDRAADPLWAAAARQAATAHAYARAEVARREADVTRRRGAVGVLGRLHRAVEAHDPDGATRVLGETKLKAALETYPELRSNIDRVRVAVERATARRMESLLQSVERYARARGWRAIRSEGGLRVAHLIQVKPSPSARTRVQSKSVRTLSWDVVRPVLDAEYARVWDRAEHRAPRLAQEFGDAIGALHGEADDDDFVLLRSVYRMLKSNVLQHSGRPASYHHDEFSADLSALLARQAKRGVRPQFELRVARKADLEYEVVTPEGELTLAGYIRAQ